MMLVVGFFVGMGIASFLDNTIILHYTYKKMDSAILGKFPVANIAELQYYLITQGNSLCQEVVTITEIKQLSIKLPLDVYKIIQEIMRRQIDEGKMPSQTEAVIALIKAGGEKLHV